MIVVSGTIDIETSDRQKGLDAFARLAEASRAEPGCVAYGIWVDPDDAGRFRIFEEWASPADLDAHFATPHMAEFMAALGDIRVSNTVLERYEVTAKSRLM